MTSYTDGRDKTTELGRLETVTDAVNHASSNTYDADVQPRQSEIDKPGFPASRSFAMFVRGRTRSLGGTVTSQFWLLRRRTSS